MHHLEDNRRPSGILENLSKEEKVVPDKAAR